ncbi:hypothetical protein AA14337_3095 [Acetobacter malorum DSM 14337]|uniref:Uncharacterized protein n=1 Tax=Acetobacter malorum DSM 14337 TaxID=1307910 RepID=A0ABQ0PZK3_9PROT|nr:hypothetical protein [Acetobacter malorum]GBQ85530.1 hypothetical protein AA14337_3095 [Acetobacter malorum DSM 14337]
MLQLNLNLVTQRQTNRRSSYLPIRPFFDPERYHVAQIHNERIARPFILQHHYSGTFPAAIASFGLFETREGRPAVLVGVVVFGVPMRTRTDVAGLLRDGEAPCELARLVLTDAVLSNAETFFVKRALRLLNDAKKTANGGPRHPIITAFSDPVPRQDAAGNSCFLGHYGCIYQASNSFYMGRGSARTLWLAPNGQSVVARSISKIVNGESGAAGAYQQILKLGAPMKTANENHRSWIARLKEDRFLRPLRHRGNHLYLFGSTKAHRRHISQNAQLVDARPKMTDTADCKAIR